MEITVHGRQFRVERVAGSDLDEGRCAYLLHGARGARYRTIRNKPNPNFMFLVNDRGWTMGAPDVWLTDAGGPLRVRR